MSAKQKLNIYDDAWVPTTCGRCYCECALRVHRVNGIAVKVEGQPDSSQGAAGGLCAKGASSLQLLYDPNRLRSPLKRTNPEKGLYVDPKWKEISWDEALDEFAFWLDKMMKENPLKILVQASILRNFRHVLAFRPWVNLGVRNITAGGGGLHCGAGAHTVAGLVHSSWSVVPDFNYCNYAIYFGANKGSGSGHSAMTAARLAAEARARGMRFVVFDPMCNFAGGKANEWVPILPGTDGAVALAMANVIVNELGIWDDVYIKRKSNGPYLVGPDLRWVRDSVTKKPMVWDAGEAKAKVYDDPTIKDYAIQGEYEVDGVRCQPAFQLLRQHLKQYSPDKASEISTVPAETIRRIATEFAKAAQIGSTITIQGKELPLRPASAILFRGGEGHENSHHTCFAVSLLNQIVGACEVPGGTLGWPACSLGYPGTGKLAFSPYKGVDGMVQTNYFGTRFVPKESKGEGPWPFHAPSINPNGGARGQLYALGHAFPMAHSSDQEEFFQKIGLNYRFEMMIGYGCNSVLSLGNRDIIAETMMKMKYIVLFEHFATELADGFADLVLPDTTFLEDLAWESGFIGQNFNYPFAMEDWAFHIYQPVVPPQEGTRGYVDVMWTLVEKLGKRKERNEALNELIGFDEAHKIKPDEAITEPELMDRVLKYLFGEEHDLEYFKKYGFIRWPKKVEEAYWRYFIDARTPIYLEYMIDAKEQMKKITDRIGLDVDYTQYTPFISWTPCTIHRTDKPEFDMYCFSYRDVLHTGSCTMEQPWLDEASQMNPYTYNITLNTDTAKRKGLKDGDVVEIESVAGRKVQGPIKLMEGQHPQTIGIAACSGHWAKGMPIARGKGTNFDALMEIDLKHCDPVSLNIETAVRVKVSRAERRSND